MAKVQDALSRLEAAIARLERAALGAAEAARRPVAAKADYDALAETTDAVAGVSMPWSGGIDRMLEG